MPNLNRVLLMGNLTRDPEMRYTPGNLAITKLGLAVNRRWRNQQGEQQEEVTFIDCDAFGKTAEMINQYMKKGRPIFIEGRLKLDQWQDKEGNNRSKMVVVVENFQFVDSKAQAGGDGGGGGGYGGGESYNNARAPQRPPQSRQAAPAGPQGGSPGGSGYDNAPAYDNPPSNDPHQPMDEENIPF